MAKVASDLEKPDGLVVVEHGEEGSTLAPLPVRALQGIGPRMETALQGMGITTIGQLARANRAILTVCFGAENAASLLQRAGGIDDSAVEPPGDPKSISRETTLVEDTADGGELKGMLRGLADEVAWALRQEGMSARCVYVKLRLLPSKRKWQPGGSGFGRLITRQVTLAVPTDLAGVVYESACKLLDAAIRVTGLANGSEVVRLIGVGTARLTHTADMVGQFPGQPGYAAPKGGADGLEGKERMLTSSIDSIRKKFGFDSIGSGASVKRQDGGVVDG
jgi:nucleotidyltransferase/DNA polymerase involved in DNA repair